MAGQTWDMITSGPDAGTVIHPPTYTTTEDQATRVQVYLSITTELGSWRLDTSEGLDHERILQPTTSDREREQLLTELVLDHARVTAVTEASVVTAKDGLSVDISATFTTDTASLTVGGTI